MIELADTLPDINVDQAEYQRLLGYPRNYEIEGRARELSDWARAWYAAHGRPWVYVRQAAEMDLAGDASGGLVNLDGARFQALPLRKSFERAGAHTAIVAAVGAGPEAETESQRLWREEKPDEYFFLEMYSSAVVEHLVTMTGARLCAWAEGHGMAVLPHYSPGYPEWDVAEMPALLRLIERTEKQSLPSEIRTLESGMLYPKKSLLAVFGLTRHTGRVRKLTDLIPCQNCSYRSCVYRRTPYVRATRTPLAEAPAPAEPGLDLNARYNVSSKALRRWASDRLRLTPRSDGGVDALFRYEGTTCSNMGRPLAFEYRVTLGPRLEHYPIRAQSCTPAPNDDGHRYMCSYVENPQRIMGSIASESPLQGKELDEALKWERPQFGAGCFCEPASREHKWGLVFETIHFALAQHENGNGNGNGNGK
jgi:hypothetical protein